MDIYVIFIFKLILNLIYLPPICRFLGNFRFATVSPTRSATDAASEMLDAAYIVKSKQTAD